tara:strand:- start:98 stop:856 length:759 start_codon:yes stop_codon:yes gene_type:complete
MKKLIAGNWKMNGTAEQGTELVSAIAEGLRTHSALHESCDFLVCPPAVYISVIKGIASKNNILCGAQDCSAHENGAYTGEVAAPMVKGVGCSHVILGHSERRQYHNESNELVAVKAKAAHEAGLIAIICVGETEAERDANVQDAVVGRQVIESLPRGANAQNTVIAYEPVWAIGTGKTASVDDVAKMHSFIRAKLQEHLADSQNMRILYGGSMKPENAEELLATPNVDGGLIGGASLKADQFLAIGLAAPQN